ncbi:MAG: hypothetical protein IPG04_37975 [Polyangiaceae bacterium]|nr:hypothetical protein [Polyangiaceae bacterium]
MKYLTLIRAVTLLHQHQRPLKTTTHRGRRVDYIEASREDVGIATRLARAVLGRSLDELPPQTRRLLGEISAMVGATRPTSASSRAPCASRSATSASGRAGARPRSRST